MEWCSTEMLWASGNSGNPINAWEGNGVEWTKLERKWSTL